MHGVWFTHRQTIKMNICGSRETLLPILRGTRQAEPVVISFTLVSTFPPLVETQRNGDVTKFIIL